MSNPLSTLTQVGPGAALVRPMPTFGTSVSPAGGSSGGLVSGSAATGNPVCEAAGTVPPQHCPSWISRFTTNLGASYTWATAAATSPNGSVLYQVGAIKSNSYLGESAEPFRWVTTAYRAVTTTAGSAGSVIWRKEYAPGPDPSDYPTAIAVSPDGTRVYVTGYSKGSGSGLDYATVAYSAGTGAQLWASRYDGPGSGLDIPNAIGVSPNGKVLYVTGQSAQSDGVLSDIATIAYDSATGDQLWVTRFDGSLHIFDRAFALRVSPDGSTVYVAGETDGSLTVPGQRTGTSGDYVTIAYSASTGAQRWLSRYEGPGHGEDFALALAVNASSVYVTGGSGSGERDFATVAYDSATGAQRWVARYVGPAHGVDTAEAIAVSKDGTRVFITGQSQGGGTAFANFDAVTIAYAASSGTQLWLARYNGPNNKFDDGRTIAVTPDGTRVIVSGVTESTNTGYVSPDDYLTISYDAAAGAEQWVAVDDPYGSFDTQLAMAMSPDGTRVYTTGFTHAGNGLFETLVSHSTSTGAQLWKARYMGAGDSVDGLEGVLSGLTGGVFAAVSPDGSRVYVTGTLDFLPAWKGPDQEFGTAAFSASTGRLLWTAVYAGQSGIGSEAKGLGVSPDGSRVYVTGWTINTFTGADYATVAYDATTGKQLWQSLYDGGATDPQHWADIPYNLAVAPDGSRVYVTGASGSAFLFGGGGDAATVAYSGATGARLWTARYDGSVKGHDAAFQVGVSQDGTRVYVGGTTDGGATGLDMLAVAYRAATGKQVWSTRYAGSGLHQDWATGLAVAPDGSRLYLTGYGIGVDTVAFDTANGAQVFANVYPVATSGDYPPTIAIAPDGTRIFVLTYDADTAVTVAYNARVGTLSWAQAYAQPGLNYVAEPTAITVNPDGARVYVTGYFSGLDGPMDDDFGTVAYDTKTGAIRWFARDSATGPIHTTSVPDFPTAIAASPDGAHVYVAGMTFFHWDYLIVAYDR